MDAAYIRHDEFGSPADVLKAEHKQIELPRNNEILVRMSACPINPSDLIPVRGSYSHRISLPNIPGYEGVGIVEYAGAGISRNLIGKRVLPLRGEGTWQDYVRSSAELAIPVPNQIDDFTAAQLYINPVTAWIICTEVLKLGPGDVLLVNACGSAIGHIFAQLSNVLGFRLIAITRNNSHTKRLHALGASNVINTSESHLYQTVMELTNGDGAAAAVDSIGGPSGNDLAYCVHPGGNFLTIGLLSGIQVNWSAIVKKAQVNAAIFHLRNWNKHVSAKKWQRTFLTLLTLIEAKQLHLAEADSCYAFSHVKEAVLAAETAKKRNGKVFLTGPAYEESI